ncbi:beta-propeller domain-containing protein [Paenibacillus abyssi]|uniref:Copper amine oxidase-like N-terminal domain-containing protein n=1 Tax=Paenibacillus abyssi TaxID=1340531 RepID=A0A917FQM4_9BACL|nr:beta-propeller domain-containing protein [Paenibacillus abyssi]GGF94968.1 hypothetical protein GCM10010916_10460 [Paenibacillus abyssi]
MRRKGAVAALLAFILFISPAAVGQLTKSTAAPANVEIIMHGQPIQLATPAIMENKTTLVPLREVAEALGAAVSWNKDNGDRTIILSREERSAAVRIGSTALIVDGRIIELDTAPRLQGNVTMVPLRAISESLGAVVAWDGINRIIRIDDPAVLPVIGTAEKLSELLKQLNNNNMKVYSRNEIAEESAADSGAAASAASGGAYSKTNVQVDGVDEADWAKTDGHFIYQLSGSRVFISDISNPAAPVLAATIDYTEESQFFPQELYVDDNRLIVIGQHNVMMAMQDEEVTGNGKESSLQKDSLTAESKASIGIWPPRHPMRSTVKAMIYDVDGEGRPQLSREVELEGSYISSRKVGSALYLVTNKYNNIYHIMESGANDLNASTFEPVYKDSAASGELMTLPLEDIRYFPASPESSTLMIGALDLERPDQAMQVSAYLGSGQTIYASTKHLYIAIGSYLQDGDTYRQETRVHKFRLDQGQVVYIGEGTVPGTILNQFSLDEYEGYFRIATTDGDMWASGEATSRNNLYVLDEQLKTIGKLEGLAPGERIYSARFMGGRAYMVTFRNVDPLFVIDLNNPASPNVLGELKIPGYSDYLHPYDENHLIGFGKETIEVPSSGIGPDETMAFYQGMKIAMFDVSDVNHPKEKFKEIIGDRGTHSDLLYDHKALLFSRNKGLMAFPLQLMEIKNKKPIESGEFPGYGKFAYQGAYVYHIDPESGFTLRGRISHLSDEELAASNRNGYDYRKAVRRILYAGDTLYTLSERKLIASDLGHLRQQGELIYPEEKSPLNKPTR